MDRFLSPAFSLQVVCTTLFFGSVLGLGPVRKNVTCNFEPSASCDWRLLEGPHVGYNTSIIGAATGARFGGPPTDVDPGSGQGHYFYFSSNQLLASDLRVLSIAYIHHQFTCALSFYHFITGPLELEILQENVRIRSIFTPQNTNSTQWQQAELNLTTTGNYNGSLAIVASNQDLGEAQLAPGEDDVFLAVDDIILTYCLPCDYDSLGDVGGIDVDGPERIDIALRVVSTYQYNASSSVCPDETFTFTIESVQPAHVSSIFSLNPDTGLLTVNARGPHLDANGTTGLLNVSVHVASSNYSDSSAVYKYYMAIPFHQPPTITHTAPPMYEINVGETFSYSFTVTSSLSQMVLNIGQSKATPPQLLSDITISPRLDINSISVTGVVSINRVLPLIVQQGTPATIVIPVEDTANGGVVYVTSQLTIRPSPPLFDQISYEYNVSENSVNHFLGPFSLIDPNGDPISTPVSSTNLFAVFSHANPPPSQPYSYFDILIIVSLNYEQHTSFSFNLSIADDVVPTLFSVAMVTVNVLPANEFSPVFVVNHKEVTISDTKMVGSNVTDFEATDNDFGQDGRINYTITAGNQDQFFGISGAGFGEVVVRRSPILPHTYNLTITAADHGTPSRHANATLIIHVIATTVVDCNSNDFGPPVVSSEFMPVVVPRGDNATLECQYSSNPVQRVYKWQRLNNVAVLFENTTNDHYTITPHSLTIHNVTPDDGDIYFCNVTNQCGSRFARLGLDVIDYPNPPSELNVTRAADTTSVGIIWTPPTVVTGSFVTKPLDGYVVQTRVIAESAEFSDVVELGVGATEVNVTGLFPGTEYSIRVVSFNVAGRTPSDNITITTIADVPKLEYLRAEGLSNGSILLEWRLEYDGGHPITNFELHVTSGARRSKRDTSPPDLVYHTNVHSNRLVTRAVSQGQTYGVMATVYNMLGASDPQITNAFVGHTDSVSCGYDDGDDDRGCPWQLQEGRIVNAQGTTRPLPSVDSEGNQFGHYISGSLGPPSTEAILLTYHRAGYICGFSFSYFLGEGSALVVRSNPSGLEVWSSLEEPSSVAGSWMSVNYTRAQRYLTSKFGETLEIVLVAAAGGQGQSSTVVVAAVDNVRVDFCLPCNFDELQNETEFRLSYVSHATIYLRQPHNMTVQAELEECSQAVVEFTITRVVPGDLESRFALVATSGQSTTVAVGSITPLLALPHTVGFLEVSATVAHSDYLFESTAVVRTALIEFVLLPTTQNCSLPEKCDFEASCSLWQLGADATITDSSLPPSLSSSSGQYLYSTYLRGSTRTAQLSSAVVNDSFCAVSFVYVCQDSLELQVVVDGLGSIWSSVEVSRFLPPGGAGVSWTSETVEIDLQAVGLQANRTLSFEFSLAEGQDPLATDDRYVALDNITLHPCIDCSAPECSFTTCFPGYYYSLSHEQCVVCPQGYYCPIWWGLPQPCPPGTYSSSFNRASRSDCMPCPADTYAVKQASTSCQSCPTGYTCSNSSAIPVAIDAGQGSCPTSQVCETGSPTSPPTLLVAVGAIGCVLLLLCLLSTCLLTCFCVRAKRRRDKKIKRHEERKKFLLHDSGSIGTAGSLGASTMTSASNTYDGHGGKRRFKRRGDVSTLLSFLSDDEPSVGIDPYLNESSWNDTERLTGQTHDKGESQSFVMMNNGFDDVSLNAESDDIHHGNELSDLGWQQSKDSKGGRTTSLF